MTEKTLLYGFAGELRSPPLHHRSFGCMRQTLIAQSKGFVAQQSTRGDEGFVLSKRKGDALVACQLETKSLSLLNEIPRFFERCGGGANTLKTDECATVIEALHDLPKTRVLIAEKMFVGNEYIVEMNAAATYCTRA